MKKIRLRMKAYLRGELCVCDIEEVLEISRQMLPSPDEA
jgi:hypothetical protein